MKTKYIVISIIILIILTAGGAVFLFLNKPQTPQTPQTIIIQDKQINDSTKPFVIKIAYPYIAGQDDFNKKSLDIINKEISDFKTNSLANDEAVKQTDPTDYAKYPRSYELDIGYDKGLPASATPKALQAGEIDNDIISIVFNVYNFEGGAHGASYFVPLNYNQKTKQIIKLADLFPNDKNYLQKISDFCIKDLTKQITAKLGSTDGTWIADGASPTADNYQFFLINKNNIVFYFPQYQIAYGAAGDFKVTMPR
jgi:hypothetical protein